MRWFWEKKVKYQPMVTAPKDGSDVLLMLVDGGEVQASYSRFGGCWCGENEDFANDQITGWRPINEH